MNLKRLLTPRDARSLQPRNSQEYLRQDIEAYENYELSDNVWSVRNPLTIIFYRDIENNYESKVVTFTKSQRVSDYRDLFVPIGYVALVYKDHELLKSDVLRCFYRYQYVLTTIVCDSSITDDVAAESLLSSIVTRKLTHEDLLQRFFYLLIRDHVPVTSVAECVNQVAITVEKDIDIQFCNDHLASMARDYAERLLSGRPTMGVEKGYMSLDSFNKKECKNVE